MDGRAIRLQRLLGAGRAVIVAIDHGMFDGPIPGMEDLPATAAKINPLVDAVLFAPGMLRHCHALFAAPRRPLAAVRLNWNTVYCFHWNYRQSRSTPAYEVEDALREGMDIALVSLTLHTGSEERDAANVGVFCKLTADAHRLGIPVIGEYFPTGHLDMSPQQLHEDVRIGSRIVAELGADLIKTFYTVDFAQVTAACPVPVLGLGAEKLPTPLAALKLAAAEVRAGAGGVVFGAMRSRWPIPWPFKPRCATWSETTPSRKPRRGSTSFLEARHEPNPLATQDRPVGLEPGTLRDAGPRLAATARSVGPPRGAAGTGAAGGRAVRRGCFLPGGRPGRGFPLRGRRGRRRVGAAAGLFAQSDHAGRAEGDAAADRRLEYAGVVRGR